MADPVSDKRSTHKPRRKRMCPNADCEKFQQPTGMMGGCECGTALVEYYIPPTDDQLESFIRVLLQAEAARAGVMSPNAGAIAAGFIMLDPKKKAMWLAEHRRFQEMADTMDRAA